MKLKEFTIIFMVLLLLCCLQTKNVNADEIRNEIVIVNQPENVNCNSGSSFTWKIEVKGKNIKYQWQYNMGGAGWYNFGDGNSSSITRNIPDKWNGWRIRCVVSDDMGSKKISSESVITINQEMEITKQPENITCNAGTLVTWKIETKGENLKYQWQYNMGGTGWYNFGDGNSLSITRNIPDKWNGWKIRCIVIDLYGNLIISNTSNIYIYDSDIWELPII